MKKCLTVVGARPQFIKAATVSREIRKRDDITEVIVHTGQHYDANMSDVFFDELDIPKPHHHLGIGSAHHGAQTGRMLAAIEAVLLTERPDWILVYGDTNSTLAGALAAAKLHIPIAHVEAGLRSFNRRMPEEINRVVTDHLSELLMPPTETGVENLRNEGISGSNVVKVGDVMFDAAQFYGARAASNSRILQTCGLDRRGFILATIHRAENTDDPARLGQIVQALHAVSATWPIVLPLHPRTRARLGSFDAGEGRLRVIEPVGYLDMVMLEQNACLIVTDSGGVQKEAFFHRVPCVTLREETEWIESVQLGWNRLAPPGTQSDLAAVIRSAVGSRGCEALPYGDGAAAVKVVNLLADRP